MKRHLYITAFVVLGVLVSFLIHGILEQAAIFLLVKDFELYGLGLSWDAWFVIHAAFSVALLVLGVVFGYRQGVYWWRVIYIEHRKPHRI